MLRNAPQFLHADCRALFNYWSTVRYNEFMPVRSDLNPAKLAKFLPNVFILNRNGERSFTYRLVGTGIVEIFGKEATNKPFVNPANPNHDQRFIDIAEAVATDPCCAVVSCRARMEMMGSLDIEQVYLPLRSDTDRVDRCSMVIACIALLEDTPTPRSNRGKFLSMEVLNVEYLGIPSVPVSPDEMT